MLIPLSIVFLCNTLLFLILLEDKFKLSTTLLCGLSCYVLSFLPAFILEKAVNHPALSISFSVFGNLFLLFLVSLFISYNNVLHKLLLSVICFNNYIFVHFLAERFLGALPIHASELKSIFLPVLFYLLFSFVIGLSFYRYFRYFSNRNTSPSVLGLILFHLLSIAFSLGYLDFFFKSYHFSGRLLFSSLCYLLSIFFTRSLYHAAKFKETDTHNSHYHALLNTEMYRITTGVSQIYELDKIKKSYDFLFHSIAKMIPEKDKKKISDFISSQKSLFEHTVFLNQYDKNPYLNAVIASYASFAEQNNIILESQTVLSDSCKITLPEICLMTDEILQVSCQQASAFSGEKKISFTLSCTNENVILESVFPHVNPVQEKKNTIAERIKDWKKIPKTIQNYYDQKIKNKKISDILSQLTADPDSKQESISLDNIDLILAQYSGNYTISTTDHTMIIRIVVYY